jgi:hypothetical protein
MPVPDTVVFGPSKDGTNTYGSVRNATEPEQFNAIRLRIGCLLNDQAGSLAIDSNGQRKVYSPFPLFVLSSIGIETLGRLFFSRMLKEGENRESMQKEAFMQAAAKVHQFLSRPIPKAEQAAFDEIWGEGAANKNPTVSEVIYRLGRNTMMHGYQMRGAFLTEDIEALDWQGGLLAVNPYWLWAKYSMAFEKLWTDFSKLQDAHPWVASLRLYRDQLLG